MSQKTVSVANFNGRILKFIFLTTLFHRACSEGNLFLKNPPTAKLVHSKPIWLDFWLDSHVDVSL